MAGPSDDIDLVTGWRRLRRTSLIGIMDALHEASCGAGDAAVVKPEGATRGAG
jgi:hypothetical protein